MIDITFVLVCVTLTLFFAISYRRERYPSNPRRLPLPPGPKPEPIIGNARHISHEDSWLKFTEWKEVYGDIIHLNVMGNRIVVLNSYKACVDLLEKAIYSDRPRFYIIDKLMGLGMVTSLAPYGDTLKRHRKLLRSALNKTAVAQYQPMQMDKVRWYLSTLLSEPGDFLPNLRLLTGKVVVQAAYGVEVQSVEDKYIVWAKAVVEGLIVATEPSNTLYNIFPILMYIPAFPGVKLKKLASEVCKIGDQLFRVPLDAVKADIAAGIAPPSIVSTILKSGNYSDEDIKWATGTLYLAGADTTYTTIVTSLFAMIKYPEVQKKAQAEIDRVVGCGRLPTFADRAALPYINCLIKETVRWRSILPTGVPHRLIEDDYYDGYWIPRGSTVIPNAWAISRDETLYEDPDRFWPERFEERKGEDVLDPYLWAFGFGRRICSGLHFADSMAFIVLTSILATFDISKPIGNDGQEVEPDETYSFGLMRSLNPFECTIRPRSTLAKAMIESISA